MRGWWGRSALTIQAAIDKAIEGGYPKQRVADLALHVQAQYLLETTFWAALIRALGVEGNCEYIQLSRDVPRKIRQPMWLYYWHRFPSHRVAGTTPASFFATFSSSPEAAR